MDSYSLLFLALTLPRLSRAAPFDNGAQHVRLRDSGFCVDIPSGAASPAALQLWDCVDGNTNQAWRHTSSSRAPGNPVVISSDTQRGHCIGVTADGEPVG